MRHIIGQHLIVGISGHTLTEDEKNFIVQNNISGIVLFSRNVAEPKQVRDLCAQIQSLRHQMKDKVPLYISIDMEGGRVARLKAPFTQWPPLRKLGDLDSPTATFNFAYSMATELKAVGINLNFAPCVDVFTNPKNTVIGDRSISSDPYMVEKHASALVRGYAKANVVPCVKHYPGHGNTVIDSHEDLPIEEASRQHLDEVELIPFKKAFRSRVQMTMTAHILYKNIDPDWPATLSEIFLKTIARQELRYKGLLITVRALQAGADLLHYCNEPASPPMAIEAILEAVKNGTLKKSDLEASHKRILSMKKDFLLDPDPLDFKTATQLIGHPDHFKLAQGIANGSVPPGLVNPM